MNKIIQFGNLYLGSVFILDGKKMVKINHLHAVDEDNWDKVNMVYPEEVTKLVGKVNHKDDRWSDYNEVVDNPSCINAG